MLQNDGGSKEENLDYDTILGTIHFVKAVKSLSESLSVEKLDNLEGQILQIKLDMKNEEKFEVEKIQELSEKII